MKKAKKRISSILALILASSQISISSCAHFRHTEATKIYLDQLVGKKVNICVNKFDVSDMENANINNKYYRKTISVITKIDLSRYRSKSICFSGKLVYIGCTSGPDMCTDWISDYAIENFKID